MLPCKDSSREQEQIRFIQLWKRGKERSPSCAANWV